MQPVPSRPDFSVPGMMPSAPMSGPPSRRGRVAVSVAAAILALAGAGVGGYMLGSQRPAAAAPAVAPTEADALSPDAAQARVCDVLKSGYAEVAALIKENNQYKSAPWSDPNFLNAINNFVASGSDFADRLESSLTPATPPQLRSAVVEYVSGLRALTISARNHAPDSQINGTGQFYNQSRHAPLRLCGLPED